MHLEGSCHCGAVKFSLDSHEPVPYQRCYCGICRKTQGGGGYLVNIGGDATTLHVDGREHVRVYQAMIDKGGALTKSRHERHFCGECGSHLWAFNSRWPELVHPVASAIDTPLPLPASNVHMMLGSKAAWIDVEVGVEIPGRPDDVCFAEYPAQSLASWHREHGFEAG
jgi:hypothetical protein